MHIIYIHPHPKRFYIDPVNILALIASIPFDVILPAIIMELAL